jgi:hypothetical protein
MILTMKVEFNNYSIIAGFATVKKGNERQKSKVLCSCNSMITYPTTIAISRLVSLIANESVIT